MGPFKTILRRTLAVLASGAHSVRKSTPTSLTTPVRSGAIILALGLATPLFVTPASAQPFPQNFTPTLTFTEIQSASFLEKGDGTIEFKVANANPFPLILDYAVCIISPNSDPDDVARFDSVTADTFIPAGGTGTYTYGVSNPDGDPIGDNDEGLNPVAFWIEFSDATNLTVNPNPVINAKGQGVFFFAGPTGPAAPPEDADLFNTLFNNAANPNPTEANSTPASALFLGGLSPTEFPARATITVTDVPEPTSITLLCLGVSAVLIRRRP